MRQLIRSMANHRLILIVVLILVVVNVVAFRRSLRLFSRLNDAAFLRYGDKMPRLLGISLEGTRTVGPVDDRVNLLLYFSSTQSRSRIIEAAKSAELLWRRSGQEGLGVTAIVRGEIPDLAGLVAHGLITYQVIIDSTGGLGDKLGVVENQNAVFLFGADGRCRFSTRNPVKAEDLRQIVAMEFLQTDPLDKAALKAASIARGQGFPDKSLLDVKSLRPTSMTEVRSKSSGVFIFFTADCSVCSLPEYLKAFSEYDRRRSDEDKTSGEPVLVFDFNFSHSDVLEEMGRLGVNSPAYIAGEELSEINNVALAEPSHLGQVVVVELDRGGIVQRILSLAELNGGIANGTTIPDKNSLAPTKAGDSEFEELFPALPFSVYDFAFHGGRYYVSDIKGNRVVVLNEHGDPENEIGRIGSGPGRLLHPGYVGVADNGTVYVQDGGNERIERFQPDGTFDGEFHTSLFEGFAVAPKNEVYLGQPEEGHLVTVYSPSGKKLRSFGGLKKFSEIYGDKFSYKDDLYSLAINRVRLSFDNEGSLYVSFMLAPILQKYDSVGRLVFERRLEGAEIDNLTRVLLTDTSDKYLSTSMDGFEARIIALNAVPDSISGKIYVVLADGSVYIADRDGFRIKFLHPQPQHQFTPYMAGVNGKGELLVASFFYWRCYRLITSSYSAKGLS